MKLNEFCQTKENQAMRKRYGSWGLGAVLAVILLLLGNASSYAQQYRHYPSLELRNDLLDPNRTFQILVPQPASGGQRYFLVPVYISNEADPNYVAPLATPSDPNFPGNVCGPIRSFEFEFLYDGEAVSLDTNASHGPAVVTVGPSIQGDSFPSIVNHWYIQYTDVVANVDSFNANPYKHIIRITGASEVPLPLINATHPPPGRTFYDSTAAMLYVRFVVNVGAPVNASRMGLDSARFNDNLGDLTNPQFPSAINPHGNVLWGAAFMNEIVRLSDQPGFDIRPLSQISTTDTKNWTLLTDLIYDPTLGTGNPSISVQLRDAVGYTRLTNISICTDQPWLDVSTSPGGGQHCIGIPVIDYSSSSGSDEQDLWISANASGLQPGVYYGYVTLTSDGAYNSPSRILVTFIVRRRPDEPTPGNGTGIRLTLTNSCTPSCSSTITFGTGPGATAGIDPIYGETIFSTSDATLHDTNVVPSQRCYAYFRPLDLTVDPQFLDPTFLGTLRDIRSDIPTGKTTILYKVVFSAGSGATTCYPVTVCVDPSDFPAGARIIARDTLNGSIFSYDLRSATQVGTQNCFVIRDPSIKSFIIEYTPGSIGIIPGFAKFGWNLISLPVIPPNMAALGIFPNAASEPYEYRASVGWATPPNGNLEYGRGYMIKYGSYIGPDSIVTGILSNAINNLRIDQGWNTIGSISVPTSVCGISFAPLPNSSTNPQQISDVFQYLTGRGYIQASFITPGRGYFVKTDSGGFYNLAVCNGKSGSDLSEQLMQQFAKVTVSDADQNAQDLFFGNYETTVSSSRFELPPTQFNMDARFATNSGYIEYNRSNYQVAIKSTSYPVSLSFSNNANEVTVTDMKGNVLGSAINGGTVTISNPNIKVVNIAQKASSSNSAAASGFALEPNYPNPFSGTTSIFYSVPVQSQVTLVIYNELGQAVRTLVDGAVAAGRHEASFDATGLAAGNYIYTMKAGNFTQSFKMTLSH